MLHDRDLKIGSPIRNAVSERKVKMAPETQMAHPWKPARAQQHWILLDMASNQALIEPEVKRQIAVQKAIAFWEF